MENLQFKVSLYQTMTNLHRRDLQRTEPGESRRSGFCRSQNSCLNWGQLCVTPKKHSVETMLICRCMKTTDGPSSCSEKIRVMRFPR